jgi:3-methyladenine DNA glycosylase Tag
MGKFIPVDLDRWAELVKAAGERDALVVEVARLKAEVEDWRNSNRVKAVRIEAQILDRLVELKAENARFCLLFANSEREVARLKAEVERLTKAGDAMAKEWVKCEGIYHANEDFIEAWNAAKSPTPLP